VAHLTSPSQAAIRGERLSTLREVIVGMDEVDREILTLRHFEQISNSDAAAVLGLRKTAASNRYVRALKRLKEAFDALPEYRDETG
jgi:RNA polymerase sigma-70 factor (ECF subfamily)